MAPKSKTKNTVAGTLGDNDGPAPVWLAQINEKWKYGKSPVRLPQVDRRRPWQMKVEKGQGENKNNQEAGAGAGAGAGEDAEVLVLKEKEKINKALQDDAKTELATPHIIDNLKSWPVNRFTSTLLPALPSTSPSPSPSTKPQPQPQPQSESQTSPPFVVQGNDQTVKAVRVRPFYRGTRGKGDRRNAGMKEFQARYRAEQAKRQAALQNSAAKVVPIALSINQAPPPPPSFPFTPPINLDSPLNDNMVIQKLSLPLPLPLDLLAGNIGEKLPQQHTHNNSEVISNLPMSTPQPSQAKFTSPRHLLPLHSKPSGNMINPRNPNYLGNRRHNLVPHPSPQRRPVTSNLPYRQDGAISRRQDDWSTWIELRIKVYGLPANVSTLDLWKCFSKEGSIATIEFYEDAHGRRDGKASVRFSPPPAKAFWRVDQYELHTKAYGTIKARIELEMNRSYLVPSPVNKLKFYPQSITVEAESMEFGFMYDQKTMMSMRRADQPPRAEIQFRQDLIHGELVVQFQISIRDPRMRMNGPLHIPQLQGLGEYNRTESIRFSIKFSHLQLINKVRDTHDKIELVISLETPPRFFRKLDETDTHEENSRYWTQNDAWYRQTDIVYNPNLLKKSAITLKKKLPIIDIGRWTTYHFVFNMQKTDRRKFEMMFDAFRDHNVQIKQLSEFDFISKKDPVIWDYIDKPISKQIKTGSELAEMMIEEIVPALAFTVRYQLEVCISQGCLNEHNMTKEFHSKLIKMDETKARDVLEYIANQKKRVFDPMEIFDWNVLRGSASRPKIPTYCAYTRSVTITPSTIYFNSPTVETTNRVIRQYAEHADRFLRVRFSDEKFEGRIRTTTKDTMNEVFTRIKRAMVNGLNVGDRHYEFLAFGNSQFRENGAYFFAPTLYLSAEKIRAWMGSFSEIKVVAKYAARIGQCFSTTRAIGGSKAFLVEIHDVKRNGFCFTDGVGKLSPFLAQLVAVELNIPLSASGPPSVFQFRLGGCKGVVAISPDAKFREIHIRPSQYKFAAPHEGLEIIRWSQFAAASLNRQLILVLSTLGVSDKVFMQKLKLQLSNLEQAMTDEKMALSLLQKDIDANQMTLAIAGMILEGFQRVREPFMTSLLQLWRAWSIKYLKEKAKISISDGALLLGCTDETGKLKGHYDLEPQKGPLSALDKEKSLPEVFVQLSKGPGNKPWVVEGPMLLARNPSLHPGDIRVVRGVDIPELHYLKDVVAFPQTGDRDLASMCSGGDLDGDDYLVMWDKDLLAHEWNHEPMDYEPPHPLELDRKITIDDITSFFVKYMKNDNLPTIAHAHVAQADLADDGVKDHKCLKLAALHSTAVDYVKSGQPATMSRDLVPRKWPHFMEKTHQPKSKTYNSGKILGKLYDQVEKIDFVPAFSLPFDKRILNAYQLQDNVLQEAALLKKQYDTAINRVMAQHEIRTEFEVWSTFVLHHSNDSKDFKFHEIIGELSAALKDQFRELCHQKAGGKDFERMGPFVAAMYTVTYEEMAQALEECRKVTLVNGEEMRVRKMVPDNMPLMSFPWLFQDILGKIANGTWPLQAVNQKFAELTEGKRTPLKENKIKRSFPEEEDILETAEGFTHRGDILELFEDNLIDYDPDVQKIAPPTDPASDSQKPANLEKGFSVDDMLFGDFKGAFVDHEKTYNQENNVPTETIIRKDSDALTNQITIPSAAESDKIQINRGGRASSSDSPGAITPISSRSNLLEARKSREGDSTGKERDDDIHVELHTEKPAVRSILTSNSPKSGRSQINSLNESDTSLGEDVNDSEPEEEIVQLDIKPSILDQLDDFLDD